MRSRLFLNVADPTLPIWYTTNALSRALKKPNTGDPLHCLQYRPDQDGQDPEPAREHEHSRNTAYFNRTGQAIGVPLRCQDDGCCRQRGVHHTKCASEGHPSESCGRFDRKDRDVARAIGWRPCCPVFEDRGPAGYAVGSDFPRGSAFRVQEVGHPEFREVR